MLLPFLIVGGVGLVVLLVSMIVGDIFDHLDVGDGAVSGTSLGIAAVVFGAAGALTVTSGLDILWAYVLAAVFALLAYLLALLLVRRLVRDSDGVPANVVGMSGVTHSEITVAGGEVSLDGPHEVERRLAFSDEPIPAGTRIRVVEHSGTRVRVVAE